MEKEMPLVSISYCEMFSFIHVAWFVLISG